MPNISTSITSNHLKYRITYFIEFQKDRKPKLSNSNKLNFAFKMMLKLISELVREDTSKNTFKMYYRLG